MALVLPIPDVHLKPKIFDKAEKILTLGQADFAIQMGDLTDDWGEEFNIGLYTRTLQRAIKFQKDFPSTLWILSNHDYGYWHANMGVRESGHSKFVEGEVLTFLNELERHGGKQKIIHIVDDCIFTHAGLTQSWALRQLQLVGYDSSTKIPDNGTLSTIVNFASSSELWQENSPIWARPQIDDYVMYPAKLQIVGHTPVKTPEEKHGVLSTDTHSTYSNGAPFGDDKFVIVDTETGEWEVVEEEDE